MKRPARFYSALFWMIALNAVIKPAWVFGIDRQVQNQVGVERYGVYFSLFNLAVVFSFLLDWGLTTYFNRQLAMIKSGSSAPDSFFQLKLLLSIIYAVFVLSTAWVTNVQHWDIVSLVILIQVLYHLLLFFRSILTAKQFFNTDAWISVIDKALMLVVAGVMLYHPAFHNSITIELFAALQVICLAVACFIALICLWKKSLLHFLRFTGFPKGKVFRRAFPFALVVLLMSLHARIDAFLLERISSNGAYETGIYAGAYRLLDATNMVGMLTASFLLPYIVKRWSNKEDIAEVISIGRNILLMAAIGITMIAWFMGDWVQQLLYHHQDDKAVTVLKWTLPAIVGYSLTQIYGTVLTATGRIKGFCLIVSIFAVLNIILNLLLIPRLGALGCCIAAIVSQIGGGLVVTLYACRKNGLTVHARSIFVYIFTGVLIATIFYVGRKLMIKEIQMIILAALFTLLIMLISGMINFKKWARQE